MIYQPKEDSYLLESQVKKYAKGKSFLDMGSGSGIQAKAALSAGASFILASDINESVVSALKSKGINAIQSDLFKNIKGKFDIIAFNPPYLPKDKKEDPESALATTGGKRGDEIILRFLKQAKKHLNKEGIILLIVSSLTPRDRITNLLNKLSFNYKILETKKLFFESLELWEIHNI
jgi:release factor glutamine methyltransferase